MPAETQHEPGERTPNRGRPGSVKPTAKNKQKSCLGNVKRVPVIRKKTRLGDIYNSSCTPPNTQYHTCLPHNYFRITSLQHSTVLRSVELAQC